MFRNAFYIYLATLLSAVCFGTSALAKPVTISAQNYSHKFITPIYQDTSRFTRGNWTNIGCQRADYVDGRYVMDVERQKGPFDKLRLKISSVDFHVVGLKVVFYNGQRASLVVRSEDSFPGRGVILDLPGRKRYIKKIIMKYGSRTSSYRPIVVCIDGHEVEEGGYGGSAPYIPPRPDYNDDNGSDDRDDYDTGSGYTQPTKWKNLGCVTAKMRNKNRYFRVGRSKGRFKTLRFRVGHHSVVVKNVSVTFGNGRKKSISIARSIKRKTVSQTFHFRHGRHIKVVDLRLKTRGIFLRSKVCLEGLSAGAGGYEDQGDDYTSKKWRSLGCKAFHNFNPRSKFVTVGRREGRFKELRLTVSGSAISLRNLGVVFGNGGDKTLVRSGVHVSRGSSTRSYRLSSRKRYLKEVEIVGYKKGRNSRAATVCVQGR